MSFVTELMKVSNDIETTTVDVMGRTLTIKLKAKLARSEKIRNMKENVESTTKPMDAADRHKRANESIGIAEDFVTKDSEERSSTPAKVLQADVTIRNKSKSGSKLGYVDVNLVPTNPINLHVNNTQLTKKSKLKDFFKKFHFKPLKSKKKNKRACTYRPPRFNPFKSLKNIIFKPGEKTPFTRASKSTTRKTVRTSTKSSQKANYNPLYDPILERPVEKKKTTKLFKFTDTNDMQVPVLSESSNFSMPDTLRTLQPETQSPVQGKVSAVDVPSQADKPPAFDSTESQTVKLPSFDNIQSQQGKLPSFNSLMGTTGKPSTFLLIMDDGQKSVLYVQPETVHKSTRKSLLLCS